MNGVRQGGKVMRFLRSPRVTVNLVITVFFLIFLVTALGYQRLVGLVPIVVAILGLIFSLLALAGEIFPKLGKGMDAGYLTTMKATTESAPEETLPQSPLKTLAVSLGWVCGSFFLIILVGFLIGAPVSVFVYTKWVRNISWLKSLLIGIGIYVFVHLVLRIAMGMILFRGILFGGIVT